MKAYSTTAGLMRQFNRLLGVFVLSLFSSQLMATETSFVVSVDHRVTVTYSRMQFDSKKGVYTTRVRIRNRSDVALYSPLRLAFDQAALNPVRLINAQGAGKDGRPYFEFKLTKGMLSAKSVTQPVNLVFAVKKDKKSANKGDPKRVVSTLASAQHASAGVESALLEPYAFPSALPAGSGRITVRFSVPLLGKPKSSETVYLRRSGDKKSVAMNDLGKDGDVAAKDGIHGVDVRIDTDKVQPDTCLRYEVFIKQKGAELLSPPLRLCVSSFPVKLAKSNVDRPALFPDGSMAVADEILLTVAPSTTAAAIRKLARGIGANVVGSYLSLNLYQLKLPSPVSVNRLLEITAQLKARAGVVGASINAIGQFALDVNDTAFDLLPSDINSQHGLKLVLAHNQATNANAWDANANGNGVTVIVLDSGLDRTHPDFGAVGDCQLVDNDCGSASTDAIGHGTQVAGVVAAKTNNALGVAGVAYGSKIYPIQVSANANVVAAQMLTGFQAVRDYVAVHPAASVINASFFAAGASATAAEWTAVCGAIDEVVLNGVTPRAVVVNAVGNNNLNGVIYPARCNDLNAALTRKDLLITVSNSASVATAACGNVGIDQRCSTSNYGAWVDLAAPGSAIRTTTIGNTYASSTGNSFSAPMVAGAAAILRSCSVPVQFDQIESTLKASADVPVPYPAFGANPAGTTPRLDIHRALSYQAPTGVGLSTGSINENNSAGATVATLTATDPDPCDKFTFALVAGAGDTDNAAFTLTGGQLALNGVANYEAKTSYSIRVRVTDFGDATFDQVLTVNVNDVDEFDVGAVTDSNLAANTVLENAVNGTTVGLTAAASDADATTNTISYSLTDSAGGRFAISTNSGVVTVAGTIDREAAASYNITVRATSADASFSDQAFTLNIVDVDEFDVGPVTDNDAAANNVAENAINGTTVGLTAAASDADATNNTITYSLTDDAGGRFAIDGNSGVVSVANGLLLDFEAAISHSITVLASSSDGSVGNQIFSINVSNINDNPPGINSNGGGATAAISVAENVTAVTTVTATDADAGSVLNYSISGADAANFAISSTGVLNFATAPNFESPTDAGGNNVYEVSVQVSDGSNSDTQNITVTVTDANEPPTGNPAITGTRTVGQTLNADLVPVNNPDGWGVSAYQWRRSGADIALNGNGSSYLLVQDDYQQFISVCVTYTDGVSSVTLCSGTDAVAVGDPHITTVDGLHYDFQGAGEFVALRNSSGMEIQLRMAAVPTAPPLPDPYTGLTSGVSVNTAVAARVGRHRVSYQPANGPNAVAGTFVLRVDGVVTALPADGIDLGDGGRVLPQAGGIQIDFPDQTTLMVNTSSWPFYGAHWLHVNVFHTSAYEGIMGARSKGSWLPRLSDGSAFGVVPAPLHERYLELYVKFADSWRVNDQTSLFDYAEGTSTATFTNKAWPTENGPYVVGNTPVAKPLGRKAAQLACRDIAGKNEKADCVFDVRVMGRKDIAKGHLLNQKVRLGATNVIVRSADRPNARGETVFTATVARHATVVPQVRGVRAVPAGTVVFMLDGERAGAAVKLDAKGQAKWKVSRLKVGKHKVSARFIPAKGSVFLPNISRQAARELAKANPAVGGNR